MARRIATGIDIGTHQVKMVVTECIEKNGVTIPKVLGTGLAESKGLRHGYIVNQADVVRAIKEAKKQAEESSGVLVKQAFLSVGGVGVDEHRARGESSISRNDGLVSESDIDRAIDSARRTFKSQLVNRAILHTIPHAYYIDGERTFGDPEHMYGQKIEIDVLFVSALKKHHDDLVRAVEDTGIEVVDEMASPLAGSFVTLTKAQKRQGCVLANIGAETVSVVVYDNGVPISIKMFDVGANDVTNDLALGFRIPPEDAEKLKRGRLSGEDFSKNKISSIMQARIKTIFELVRAHLKTIGKDGLLPAGIIISGGGSGMGLIDEIAKATLRLPSKRAEIRTSSGIEIKDAMWAVAYGLTIWGLMENEETKPVRAIKKAGGSVMSFVKQFLP
jgi:cell division protein FtsA